MDPKGASGAFKRRAAEEWTLERIAQLTVQDIKQLRENAERLNETGVATLCSEALRIARQPRSQAKGKSTPRTKARRMVARAKAFEMRGVWLEDRRTSWGGVRKSDGTVVLALWAEAIESADGTCAYLLWAPNADGLHPWSEKAAGKERLEHCKRALEQGRAEGMLVYGERLEGYLPEDKAHAVHGADPETLLVFQVQMRGKEFWATWGKKTEPVLVTA